MKVMTDVCQHENKRFSTSFAIGDLNKLEVSKYYDCNDCGETICESETINLSKVIGLTDDRSEVKSKRLKKKLVGVDIV